MDKPDYWEIPTTDLAKTSQFLAELFGWKIAPSGDNYVMFSVEGGMGGGIQQVDEPPGHGIRVYIQVDDIPARLARVEELGGEVLHAKTEIGNDWGYWAEFRAPGGCRLGLWSKT